MLRVFKNNNFYLILSLSVFIITAIFSESFYHPDEHYAILELLQLKISDFTKPEIFNWDYHLKIRSWFQVFIYYLIYLITPFNNPFLLAFIYRLFNGLLGWFSIYLLLKKYFRDDDYQKKLLFYSLIWFIPFIFVRTSSESLSTSIFIIGSLLFLEQKSFLAGLLWGMSFLIRYQMGICIMVASLWGLAKNKDLKSFSINALGVILLLVVGPLIDYWGYGEWVYSPYQYFYHNVIEGKASNFGVSPFWYYLITPLKKGGGPLALFFAISLFLYLKDNIKSFWSLIILVFFLIHSLISHKEIRFISIIYILAPFLFLSLKDKYPFLKKKKILTIVLIINFFIILKTSFTPVDGSIGLYKKIYYAQEMKYLTLADNHGNHFKLTRPFYERPGVKVIGKTPKELRSLKGNHHIITTTYQEFLQFQKDSKCKQSYLSYPQFILKLNYFGWLKRSSITAIWNCRF